MYVYGRKRRKGQITYWVGYMYMTGGQGRLRTGCRMHYNSTGDREAEGSEGPVVTSGLCGRGAFHKSSLGSSTRGTNAVTDPKQTNKQTKREQLLVIDLQSFVLSIESRIQQI